MLSLARATSVPRLSLDPLDRLAIAYLVLPLVIFIVGWLEYWAALPLLGCVAYALMPLVRSEAFRQQRLPVTPLQLAVAAGAGIAWTVFGGTGHLLFANPDWHIRDAVLHDLVASPWPVSYGPIDGKESILRAPIAYYLPAAVIGKWMGLTAAHFAMSLWTALGATVFLLQVLSLTVSRAAIAVMVTSIIVLFSGLDIIGCLINYGGRFRDNWDIAAHLEWWAGNYQYSSMTTQLFWVPNHALGGWLIIALLFRDVRGTPLLLMLPMVLVAATLWSPLTLLGLIPFIALRFVDTIIRERTFRFLEPQVWMPALAVGSVIAAYLVLDSTGISRGVAVHAEDAGRAANELLQQAQFFLLEAGFIGFAILAIRPSSQVVLALVILALLPLVHFGPGNDLVMRGSIPSLTVLAIAACLALSQKASESKMVKKQWVIACLLMVGAVTPIQEFARAIVLRAWPINLKATLIAASCGKYSPHYVARLGDELVVRLLRKPHRIPLGLGDSAACDNPAVELMHQRHLL